MSRSSQSNDGGISLILIQLAFSGQLFHVRNNESCIYVRIIGGFRGESIKTIEGKDVTPVSRTKRHQLHRYVMF